MVACSVSFTCLLLVSERDEAAVWSNITILQYYITTSHSSHRPGTGSSWQASQWTLCSLRGSAFPHRENRNQKTPVSDDKSVVSRIWCTHSLCQDKGTQDKAHSEDGRRWVPCSSFPAYQHQRRGLYRSPYWGSQVSSRNVGEGHRCEAQIHEGFQAAVPNLWWQVPSGLQRRGLPETKRHGREGHDRRYKSEYSLDLYL